MKTALVGFIMRMVADQFGTEARAWALADACDTPVAWVRVDRRGPTPFFYPVCATADGKVCGADVEWTDPACAGPDDDDPGRVEHACRVAATDYIPEECDGLADRLRQILTDPEECERR